ncbi:MAG TPA: hypothetical protein VFB99_14975, partial [Vicinamibacterales bacterium]|nr:hypothetical protein [Vicinamibacterales bacterium]
MNPSTEALAWALVHFIWQGAALALVAYFAMRWLRLPADGRYLAGGPAIVFLPVIFWSWASMETPMALLFTAYMIPVCIIDNILRPIVMGRGLVTPMPVVFVGLIGGVLTHGVIG